MTSVPIVQVIGNAKLLKLRGDVGWSGFEFSNKGFEHKSEIAGTFAQLACKVGSLTLCQAIGRKSKTSENTKPQFIAT